MTKGERSQYMYVGLAMMSQLKSATSQDNDVM